MRHFVLICVLLMLAACGSEAETGTTSAEPATQGSEKATPEPVAEDTVAAVVETADAAATGGVRGPIMVGDPNAPVLIEEYASLTCPACASFHNLVYPEVKEKLIDTGRARFEFNNFILGGQVDLAASTVIRCTTQPVAEKYLAALFKSQREWVRSKDVRGALATTARLFGINRVQFDRCLQDTTMHRHLIDMTKGASDRGVTATPTLYVDGKKLDNFAFDTIMKAVESAED